MTARQDKRGRYHNTLDQPVLGLEQAEDLKAKLFNAVRSADKEAMAKVHKAAQAKEQGDG